MALTGERSASAGDPPALTGERSASGWRQGRRAVWAVLALTLLAAVVGVVTVARHVGAPRALPTETWPVVVYGASSGGVGAALGVARERVAVLLVEPTDRPGGMLTNGVTADLVRPETSTGVFDDVRRSVAARYARAGIRGQAVRDGLSPEPDVALAVVRDLLDAEPEITTRTGWWLDERPGAVELDGDELRAITVTNGAERVRLRAAAFVDASPEGDLLGAAGREGLDWVVGREGRDVHGERHAPARSDRRQQAYAYRLTLEVGGRTDYRVPATYVADLPRYRQVDDGATKFDCRHVVDGVERDYRGMRIQRCLVDGKLDVSIDLIGLNDAYPTQPRALRAVTERRLRDFAVGWLHFLRTEGGHPELGLSRDDYRDNGGLPSMLYVREGRRAVGRTVFVERDVVPPPWAPQRRLPLRPTSVAVGDYGLDSHCVRPVGAVSSATVPCTGAFWTSVRPFQVPFEVMVPVRLQRLLVPVPVSASHVGYSTLRTEPVRANLGFAAGIAAAWAARDGGLVADTDVRALQRTLVAHGQAVVFIYGMDRRSPDFAADQLAVAWGRATLPPDSYRLR